MIIKNRKNSKDEFSEGRQSNRAFKLHMVRFYPIGAVETIRMRRILSYEVPVAEPEIYRLFNSFLDMENGVEVDAKAVLVRYLSYVPALLDRDGDIVLDVNSIFEIVQPMAVSILVGYVLKGAFDYDISKVEKSVMIEKVKQLIKGRTNG